MLEISPTTRFPFSRQNRKIDLNFLKVDLIDCFQLFIVKIQIVTRAATQIANCLVV